MKRSFTLFVSTLVLLSLLLTACGTTVPATAARSGSTDDSAKVEFAGKVEAIIDNKWTINGQTVEVSADLAKQLPFQVGDEVKVEAIVNADGSVRAQSMISFAADANANDNNSNDDNGNADNSNGDNGNNANGNDDNSNAANSNDDNGNDDNSNDDNGNDNNNNDDKDDDKNDDNDND